MIVYVLKKVRSEGKKLFSLYEEMKELFNRHDLSANIVLPEGWR